MTPLAERLLLSGRASMTSLEWRALWCVSEGDGTFFPVEGATRVGVSAARSSNVPGLSTAALSLLRRRLISVSPVVDPVTGAPVIPVADVTSAGARALRSRDALAHRPPAHLSFRTPAEFSTIVARWAEPSMVGEWHTTAASVENLWMLDRFGPARDVIPPTPTTDDDSRSGTASWPSPTHRLDNDMPLSGVKELVTRGLAEHDSTGIVISPAGQRVLEVRSDVVVVLEVRHLVYRDHRVSFASGEDQARRGTPPGRGLLVCSCGWSAVVAPASDRSWADGPPGDAHWAALEGPEILRQLRRRELPRWVSRLVT
ncbi:hypothetical protein OVN18_12955 [Microcella daejeonensis]|uniref:Uncharacterized protein n=1 Tax=Microcella daejeonensis TaxID=2994971 RepID=A0A9E8MKY9_9MICO|nr:hypothetical protein [Microcella daejeonensis]WAB81423.1 hypothetical protein OVN18_12955 [Microcella daejeonensis]